MLDTRIEFGEAPQDITKDVDFFKNHVNKFLRIDLACGKQKKDGFVGVDKVPVDGVDIVCDLDEYPWPFKDDSVYEIYCSHYVEHVKDLVRFMEECYRILKPLSIMTIVCPYWANIRAWQDPTHVRCINEKTFYYFDKQWVKSIKMDHYVGNCDFEVVAVTPLVSSDWQGRSDEAIRWAMKYYINVVDDLVITLRKRV